MSPLLRCDYRALILAAYFLDGTLIRFVCASCCLTQNILFTSALVRSYCVECRPLRLHFALRLRLSRTSSLAEGYAQLPVPFAPAGESKL